MAVAKILPVMVIATNRHGLTSSGAAVFAILGSLGLVIWFYGCLAARCHAVLFERHFR
ncbi:MAG: hypothetical protein HYY98_11910 [Burkholderiales bacterium]|nr:hypothetical protein [Burkholderiales bacterium]